ncbi:MAG: polysaccharide biosynthesis/export family protein [Candidatus Zixiibacteriota bacterium]
MSLQIRLTHICLIFAFVLFSVGMLAADEYIIGPEDELEISFWQVPELNQTVVVRQDGKVTLSIIGEIDAAGLTPRELSEKIERNVSLYDKRISQAAVTVTGYNSQKVFVAGQVASPGKKTFEVIPDIWTVIKEAGGATEQGDLTRVSIIKSQESGGEVINVNVLEAIAKGTVEQLPKLVSGTTIEVPRAAGGVPGRQLTSDYIERKNLFYVIGAVNQPGNHAYEGQMDIIDALGAAGGITEAADLKNVKVISKNGQGTTVLHANLEEYRTQGQAKRIVISPEDMIVVSEKGRGFISWENLRDFSAVATSLVTIYLLFDRNDSNNN